jgi:hypothetical protein
VDREKLDDQVIIHESCHAAGKAVVFQPDAGIGGPVVLVHVCWYVRFYEKLLLLDCTPEGAWSWPRSAGTTLASPLGCTRLLYFFLLLLLVVEDVVTITDIPEVVLQWNT